MGRFLNIFFILISCLLFSQNQFEETDNWAKRISYKGDLNLLVSELTADANNDIEKTRAIYFWITENVKYDIRAYNKGKRIYRFKCKTNEDCNLKESQFENKIIRKTLNRKKAICSGYALLFKRMCDLAGVNCAVINGYIKTKPTQVGRMGILDHAWNSVRIDNQLYYLDLTWASGYTENGKNNQLKKFVKQRNDFYWFTPVKKFTINHFPEKTEIISNTNITKEDFLNRPYIENDIIPLIDLMEPKTGVLKPEINDTIYFKFQFSGRIENIQVNTNLKKNPKIYFLNKRKQKIFNKHAFERQEYIDFNKENSTYKFFYVVENKDLKYIEILFDYEPKLRFLINSEDENSK